MGFWGHLGDVVAPFNITQQARNEARAWVNLPTDQAQRAVRQFVSAAVAQKNPHALNGVIEELSDQIKLADSWDFQQEVNALFWFFKECVGNELDGASEVAPHPGEDPAKE